MVYIDHINYVYMYRSGRWMKRVFSILFFEKVLVR